MEKPGVVSRRSFIETSSLAMAGVIAASLAGVQKQSPLSGCTVAYAETASSVASASSSGSSIASGAASSAASGSASSASSSATSSATPAASVVPDGNVTYSPAETMDADIVIVGAGPAGIGATLEALDAGATIILLEKTDAIGGMSFGTEGVFGYGSKMQADAGVELPSLIDIVNEELTYTNYRVDANLWREFVNQSGETIDWMMDHGVQFDRVDTYQGASFFESFHWWPGGNGADFGPIMEKELDGKEGLTILTSTPVVDLVIEDGKATGVYAQKSDGTVIQVNGKGVVICTGGFSQDKELMTKLSGIDWSNAGGFVTPATGDGYRMMSKAGGVSNSVCFINTMCVQTPDQTQDQTPINIATNYECLMQINQDGERFMAEDIFAKYFAMLDLNAIATQKCAWTFFDSKNIDRLENVGIDYGFVTFKVGDKLDGLTDQLEQYAGTDNVKKGETLADLAAEIGADPDVLQNTVDRYNGFCASGVDEDFGASADVLHEIGDGPYYAVHADRFVSATIGGIKVNRKNEVIDAQGEPIPGLYSAGVDSCCLYKETYNIQLSGGMMAYNLYSGRNAARNILGTE